jgi:hypothetical protein
MLNASIAEKYSREERQGECHAEEIREGHRTSVSVKVLCVDVVFVYVVVSRSYFKA